MLVDHLLEFVAFDVLHHQVMDLGLVLHGRVDVVCPHDVGMVQRGDGLSFTVEPLQCGGRGVVGSGREDFDCATAPHHLVFGQEYRSHAALAERFQDLIGAKNETLVLSAQQLGGLPASENVSTHQLFGDLASGVEIGAPVPHLLQQTLHLIIRNDAALLGETEEFVNGKFGRHDYQPNSTNTAYTPQLTKSITPQANAQVALSNGKCPKMGRKTDSRF